MRHSLDPRSGLFRSLLALALLAWSALAFNAFAHPIAMIGVPAAHAPTTASKSHCDGMGMMHMSSRTSHHPVPAHPAGSEHGCCQNGGCYCASLCSAIAAVPYLGVPVQPAHDPALSLIHSEPALAQSAPPLRPPIA